MAKKQQKVKSSKKTTASTKGPKKINYGCNGGFCTATPRKAHIGAPGSQVELTATNTNVTITFVGGKSPFTPNVPSIALLQGIPQTFTVSTTASGNYDYDLICSGPKTCPALQDSPDMIVP